MSEKQNKIAAEEDRLDRAFIKSAFNRIAGTPDGVMLFRYLFDICSPNKPLTDVAQIGHVNSSDIMHTNEGKRLPYLNIREMIKDEYLKEIEFGKSLKERIRHVR